VTIGKITTFTDGRSGAATEISAEVPVKLNLRLNMYASMAGAYDYENKDFFHLLPTKTRLEELTAIRLLHNISSGAAERGNLDDMGTPEDILKYFSTIWISGKGRNTKNDLLYDWQAEWRKYFPSYADQMYNILSSMLPGTLDALYVEPALVNGLVWDGDQPATLTYESTPIGADVYVDNVHFGTTNFYEKEISPGDHVVRIELGSFNPEEGDYSFNPGTNIQISTTLETGGEPVDWWEKLKDMITASKLLAYLVNRSLFKIGYELLTGRELTNEEYDLIKPQIADWILPINAIHKLFYGTNIKGEAEEFGSGTDYLDLVFGLMLFVPGSKIAGIGIKAGEKLGAKGFMRVIEELGLKGASGDVVKLFAESDNFKWLLEAIRIEPAAFAKAAPKLSKEVQALISDALKKQHPQAASQLFESAITAFEAGKISSSPAFNKLLSITAKGTPLNKVMKAIGAIAGIDIIMSWLASDNIVTGTSFLINKLKTAVKDGVMTKAQALAELDKVQAWKDYATDFIDKSTILNPLLWIFRTILLVNTDQAQLSIDIERQLISEAEIPEEEKKGTLNISVDPSDAVITIAGFPAIISGGSYEMPVGSYTIQASKEDYYTKSVTAFINNNETTTIGITLTEKPPGIPDVPEKATLKIESVPSGAKIYLNGDYQYVETPFSKIVDPGNYIIRLELTDYKTSEETIELDEGEERDYVKILELVEVPPDIPPTPPVEEPARIIEVPLEPVPVGYDLWRITIRAIDAVTGAEINAQILVDNAITEKYTPWWFDWTPGDLHNIKLRRTGYYEADINYQVKDLPETAVAPEEDLIIEMTPTTTEYNAWKVTIKAVDAVTGSAINASILINDQFMDKYTPYYFYMLPEATYNVKLRRKGYYQGEVTFTTDPLPT